MMMRLYDQDKDIVVHYELDHHEYTKLMLASKFCLMLDGQAPWSPRLVEYIAAGCVPVIVSDALLPPFQRILNWSTFSVHVCVPTPTCSMTCLEYILQPYLPAACNFVVCISYMRFVDDESEARLF